MADAINKGLTAQTANNIQAPFKLDMESVYNVMLDDVMELINEKIKEGVTPAELERYINSLIG